MNKLHELYKKVLEESYDLVPYYDDIDLSDYDIDEYEAYDEAHQIAKDGGVTILRDKDLSGILIDSSNRKVIGGLWIGITNDIFSFDIAIDSSYQNIGLSHKLIIGAIDEFNQNKDVYDNLKMEVDVINPKLALILKNKYGFYKIADLSQNRVLMSVN